MWVLCAKGDLPHHDAASLHDQEATLAAVTNELRIVKDECRRLRIQMEGVDAHQIEVLKTQWSHVTPEVTARQNTSLATRLVELKNALKAEREQCTRVKSSNVEKHLAAQNPSHGDEPQDTGCRGKHGAEAERGARIPVSGTT